MPQLLTLSRAARIAGVTRSELQKRLREANTESFEGQIRVSDLHALYPEVDLEHDPVFERIERIKSSARPKTEYTDGWMPDAEVLMTRLKQMNRVLVRTKADVANQVVAVGIPILLDSGEIIRGPRVLVPGDVQDEPVTPESLENWVHDGWVDLRESNCAMWIERFQRIHDEIESIPEADTSSRYLRSRRFWHDQDEIQPGKIVGWILAVEEHGTRIKG